MPSYYCRAHLASVCLSVCACVYVCVCVCVVRVVSGRNFGSYVTHETKNFIYFYLGQVAILLFKSG